MKTHYKFIHFNKANTKGKTSEWHCFNNHSIQLLGKIQWYSPWRQYCYFVRDEGVYSRGCLEDINDFIGQLEEERKGE